MRTRACRFDAVCFDCDSTLSRIEGIDELGRRAGCLDEIAAMTNAAMDGGLSLDAIYQKRMDLVRPARSDLQWLSQRYAEEAVDGAHHVISQLQEAGVHVYVISGGLLPAIIPSAKTLGIDAENVFAVDVHFDSSGAYAGFESSSKLTQDDGKAVICRSIAERHGSIAMVGDGKTDLAAREGGAYVIGFGGVANREVMRLNADHFITGPSLHDVLDVLLVDSPQETQ